VNPRSELTVGQALARAPATILGGTRDAAGQLQQGVVRARTDFRNTLNPREVASRVSATGGLNTTVNGSGVETNTATLSSTPSSGNSGSNGSNATGTNATGVSTGTATPTTASASGENSAENGK
jgi:hypothetical protein